MKHLPYRSTKVDGKLVKVHRLIWEKANGKIPDGFEVHHIDGNSLNNSLENLRCVSTLEHHRLHGTKLLRLNSEWYKICLECDKLYSLNEFRLKRKGSKSHMSYCRKCERQLRHKHYIENLEYERERNRLYARKKYGQLEFSRGGYLG